MNDTTLYAICGAAVVLLLLIIRSRLSRSASKQEVSPPSQSEPPSRSISVEPQQVVHRLCPHHNVVQSFPVEQKDSIDEHLDVLTRKLAEKEGRLRLSKSKIRETQFEIENLQAIDQDVRHRYREIMENLKTDLLANEKECMKLQEQIEWVSRRRAELREEVRHGQRMYGEAAAELANNLADIQRSRKPPGMVFTKPPLQYSNTSLRHRKEPMLPKSSPVGSIVIKSPDSKSPERAYSRHRVPHDYVHEKY
ncbi:hypothetical protein NE865_02269 [Phthorimaea operculella]|nr:hypothetical protein NE865_02269 [Phthorimaea operculella]